MRLKVLTQWVLMSSILLSSCTGDEQVAESMPLSTDSDLAREFYDAGMLAFDQIKYKLAYHSFQMAIEEDPDFFMAYFWLYFMTQKSENCQVDKAFEVEAALSDGEKEIQNALKYLVSGQNEKTVEHLQEAARLYPGDPHVHKILYILQFQYLKDVEGAIASMERAIEAVPGYDLAYNQLGYALMELEDFDGAREAFDTYIELSPGLANPYDSKGDYYMQLKEYDLAYESYMKAYELDSGFTMSKKKAEKAKHLMDH